MTNWHQMTGDKAETKHRKDAELIVRQLAAWAPPMEPRSSLVDQWMSCGLCGEPARPARGLTFPESHIPSCPWRQAKEWVEAEHGRSINDYYARMAAENKDSGD